MLRPDCHRICAVRAGRRAWFAIACCRMQRALPDQSELLRTQNAQCIASDDPRLKEK
jgi:hypothetical protein